MTRKLSDDFVKKVASKLSKANGAYAKVYPGEPTSRQPVHTLYGGAHLFKAATTARIGELAAKSFAQYAPTPEILAQALGFDASRALIDTVHRRVAAKLQREAVEDFRIDFEDGYGNRPDSEEDSCAEFAAQELAAGMQAKSISPFIGIRIKPFSEELKRRSIRTLDIFVSTLAKATKGKLPDGFVVTLPKITVAEQVAALVKIFEQLEKANKLKSGSLKVEFMIETPQSIFNDDGQAALSSFLHAAAGRSVAAHFGVYDYTASNNITAAYQSMDHPACDFARQMMKLAFTDTGLWLSDGATNVMPVGPHRAGASGPLSPKQEKENIEVVYKAWQLSYAHIRHSLRHGFYQGWDLHPAQIPVRYAACYMFFLEGLEAASKRLKNFIDKAAQATLVGEIFDDAATGQGLLNYFIRAMSCGAIEEKEVLATGLTLAEVRSRSFVKILAGRRPR